MGKSLKARSITIPAALYFGALFTSSFDIFLVVDVGFTFRICQVLLSLAMLCALAKSIRTNAAISPPAILSLDIWTGISVFSMLLHGASARGAGYCIWLVFNVLVIYGSSHIFDTWAQIASLARHYIGSFVFVASFGLFQFFAGALGVGNFLAVQWWIPGKLARINGFSYEPSYFATYLILGWVLVAYLLEQPRNQWPMRRLPLWFALMSLSLVLCSSRIGYIAISLWGVRCLVKIPFGSRTRRATITKIIAASTALAAATAVAIMFFQWAAMNDLTFLLEGTGLAGTASHSLDQRSKSTEQTLAVFEKNLAIGVGLGGVAEEIARMRGADASNREVVKLSEGSSVGAEVLAGTGIIGFFFLVLYFFRLYTRSEQLSRRSPPHVRSLIKGLMYALTMELILLQFNQNILRPYLWLHVAILSCVVGYISRTANPVRRVKDQTLATYTNIGMTSAPRELTTT